MNNKRSETRLDRNETIFIETKNSFDGAPPNEMLICNSVDLSANGIRALIDQPLPCGSIYQLCVEIHHPHELLMLVASVKWIDVLPDDGGYAIGLEIFDSDETDVERWKRYIATELSHIVSDEGDDKDVVNFPE